MHEGNGVSNIGAADCYFHIYIEVIISDNLAAAANAKCARIIHHDPFRTDRELDAAAKNLACIHPGCTFAYAGENIVL